MSLPVTQRKDMTKHMAILQIDKNGCMLFGDDIMQYLTRYINQGDIMVISDRIFKFIDTFIIDNIMTGLESLGFETKRIVVDEKEEPRNIWINDKCVSNPKYRSIV